MNAAVVWFVSSIIRNQTRENGAKNTFRKVFRRFFIRNSDLSETRLAAI